MKISDEKKESITNTINSLIRMSNDSGASENETLTAISKAKKMMNKYNISQSDLKKQDRDKNQFKKVKIFDKFKYKTNFFVPQLRLLYNCCGYINTENEYVIFGSKKDILLFEYFYNFIYNTMFSELTKFKKTAVYKNDSRHGKSKCTDFCKGFSMSIYDRLSLLNKDNYSSVEYGLVETNKMKIVESDYKLFLKKTGVRTKNGPSARINTNRNAYKKGSDIGNNVNLNSGISGSYNKSRISIN